MPLQEKTFASRIQANSCQTRESTEFKMVYHRCTGSVHGECANEKLVGSICSCKNLKHRQGTILPASFFFFLPSRIGSLKVAQTMYIAPYGRYGCCHAIEVTFSIEFNKEVSYQQHQCEGNVIASQVPGYRQKTELVHSHPRNKLLKFGNGMRKNERERKALQSTQRNTKSITLECLKERATCGNGQVFFI